MPWDLFCRVVDNFGDIGVCWRLAAQLAEQGQLVRLWVDDASALRWMAPQHEATHPLVAVNDWAAAAGDAAPLPGEVVIEAFGCDPPPAFVARMAAQHQRTGKQPVWINLEYLSAELYAERNHRLPSPQASGPAAGLVKHFFFPGFSAGSGGLLRESDLQQRHRDFEPAAWLQSMGIALLPREQAFSLFCYPAAPLAQLIEALSNGNGNGNDQPIAMLATAGAASAALSELLGPSLQRGAVRAVMLPWLTQRDYDHLLWSCDVNWVRGEDSAVRAQWAGRPFVWQLYPQSDGADRPKADAFLRRFFEPSVRSAEPQLESAVTGMWQHWNGWQATEPDWTLMLGDRSSWQAQCLAWRRYLRSQPDLLSRLTAFVSEVR